MIRDFWKLFARNLGGRDGQEAVKHDVATFRLPAWMRVNFVVVFAFQPLPMILLSPLAGAVELALIALLLGLWLPNYTVRLDKYGAELYGLRRLRWEEVKAAKYRKVLGLPYVYVRRHRGFGCWIPVYFVGDGDLRRALVEAAPSDNPIRLISLPA